jgi:antitoxin component YwqK of YwqJK toxin-antitoxin module
MDNKEKIFWIQQRESRELAEMLNASKNGKMEGPAKSYYESGTLKSEVTFKNGELEGPIKEYYESGEIVIKTYEDGKFISKKECDKQGKLIKEK